MTACSLRVLSLAVFTFSFMSALPSADQVRRQTPGASSVPMEIALKVGNVAYDAKGQGSCMHARQASIYNVLSEMRTVKHEADGRSLQLTLWTPKDGSAQMFSLSINGKPNASVSTVRGGQVSGSGDVRFEPSGKGGAFTVAAKDQAGASITGTIKCEAFTAAVAEGGN